MTAEVSERMRELQSGKYDLQALWAKYEDIAMHFNDLLMRLRTQALAGIAAISTLIGIFTKADNASISLDWAIAAWAFGGLAIFWIAIACIDLLYYNRLLAGAVTALAELEKQICSSTFDGIMMSSRIIEEFTKPGKIYEPSYKGVIMFYALVLIVLLGGVWFFATQGQFF